MRVLKVLEGFGQSNLQTPEKLKFLICPILAQGKADQEKFYQLFDQYWAQIEQPWEMPIEQKPKTLTFNQDWFRWLIVGLAAIGLMVAAYFIDDIDPVPVEVHFLNPTEVRIGDRVKFENTSANFDSLCIFKWEIFDAKSNELEFSESDSFHLSYEILQVGVSPVKKVRLIGFTPEKNDTSVFESQFTILCDNAPSFKNIEAVRNAKPGEKLNFKVDLLEDDDVEVTWNMGETTIKQKIEEPVIKKGKSVEHEFRREGLYKIRLQAVRNGVEGYCQTDTLINVKIGEERPYLAEMALEEDNVFPLVNFSYGMWLLMGMVGLGLLWFWVKWAARKPPLADSNEDNLDLAAAAKGFHPMTKPRIGFHLGRMMAL